MSSLERYEMGDEIGRGSMGIVYRAHDTEEDRTVALKELFVADGVTDAKAEELLERFEREAEAASRLDHPNIVNVFDAFTDDDRHFIVMDYLEGQTLSVLLEHGHLDVDASASITTQVLAALEVAHEAGIIHRDLKPENIFVMDDGSVKVTDFGVARMDDSDSNLTVAGQVLGTLGYMSPEQVKGESVDARTDIFSVGVILYQMLVGANPFGADQPTTVMYRISYAEPPAPDPFVEDLPENMTPIIKKAMAKDVALRYQNATEMKADLETGNTPDVTAIEVAVVARAAEQATAAAQPVAAPNKRRLPSPKVLIAAALALVLVAAAGGGFYLYRQNQLAEEAARRVVIIEEGAVVIDGISEAKALRAELVAVLDSLEAKADANDAALDRWDSEWSKRQSSYQQRVAEVESHNTREQQRYLDSYYEYTWFGYVMDSGYDYVPSYWSTPSYPDKPSKVNVNVSSEQAQLSALSDKVEALRSSVTTEQTQSAYFHVVYATTDVALIALEEEITAAIAMMDDLVTSKADKGDIMVKAQIDKVDAARLDEPYAAIDTEMGLYLQNYGVSMEELKSAEETSSAESSETTAPEGEE